MTPPGVFGTWEAPEMGLRGLYPPVERKRVLESPVEASSSWPILRGWPRENPLTGSTGKTVSTPLTRVPDTVAVSVNLPLSPVDLQSVQPLSGSGGGPLMPPMVGESRPAAPAIALADPPTTKVACPGPGYEKVRIPGTNIVTWGKRNR
jgi:hypothetical protein